jgi:fido (protein-threonine AMPylation protein)
MIRSTAIVGGNAHGVITSPICDSYCFIATYFGRVYLHINEWKGRGKWQEGIFVTFIIGRNSRGWVAYDCRDVPRTSEFRTFRFIRPIGGCLSKDIFCNNDVLEEFVDVRNRELISSALEICSLYSCDDNYFKTSRKFQENQRFKMIEEDLRSHVNREKYDVVQKNYYEAAQFLLRDGNESSRCPYVTSLRDSSELSTSMILEVHNILGRDLISKAGCFRQNKNANCGKFETFVPAHEVHDAMLEFVNFVNEDLLSIPELNCYTKAAMVMYYFVKIHPFHDGNGRISRLLCNWILRNAGNYNATLIITHRILLLIFKIVSIFIHLALCNECPNAYLFQVPLIDCS